MRKVLFILSVFVAVLLTGCGTPTPPAPTYDLQFQAIETQIKESIPLVVNENITLITENYNFDATIKWESSNEEVLTSEGVFKNSTLETFDVVLSYVIEIKGVTREGEIKVKVEPDEMNAKFAAVENIIRTSIPDSTDKDITLETEYYSYGAKIEWQSSNESVITTKGVVTNYSQDPVKVTLTYTITIKNEQKTNAIIVEVLCTENYMFELDEKEIYIRIDQYIELRGKVYKKGELYTTYHSNIEIKGEYDKKVPGKYDLLACVDINVKRIDQENNEYHEKITLEDPFTLIVLDTNLVSFEELNAHESKEVEYSFALKNYYVICSIGKLEIFNLDNPDQPQIVKVNGRCNSYYYKDGYLYISSVDPYDDIYSGNFTGYISQIDLEKGTVVKEIKVNSAPDSIVVDKRNNIIISKEQNQHIDIEYLDMSTQELSVLCQGYYGDQLIYNEKDDMVLIIGTESTKKPEVYKYNEKAKAFELVDKKNRLESTATIPCIYARYQNSFIYGDPMNDKAYGEFVDGEIITKKIPLIYKHILFDSKDIANIDDEYFVFLQQNPNACYITVCEKESNEYKVYQVTNLTNNEIVSIHLYNGKIYMFDKTLGKLLLVK